MRRPGLVGRRWIQSALAALMMTAFVLLDAGQASLGANAKAAPAAGKFAGQISIGHGRKLYLRCAGRGSPTVVMESGIHDSSDTWTLTDTRPPVPPSPSVFTGVSRFTHVCIYDRPGTIRYTSPPALTKRSTPMKMPRTLSSMADDLHALLTSARIPGPYLLVGHSYGGLIVRLFAQRFPSDTAGLVLVDAFGTNIRGLFGPRLWPRYVRVLNHPGTALDNLRGFETVEVDGAIATVQKAGPLPRIPLAVISKTEPFATSPTAPRAVTTRLEQVWPKVQAALVRLEPQTPHVFATGSDHYVQIEAPDLVISMIRLILGRVPGSG